MKNIIILLIASVIISVSLSSCAFTKSCHVSVSITPPSITLACDSLLQSLFAKGGRIIIQPAVKTDRLKVGGKQYQEVKIKINK